VAANPYVKGLCHANLLKTLLAGLIDLHADLCQKLYKFSKILKRKMNQKIEVTQ
jgi:hypothetical protein